MTEWKLNLFVVLYLWTTFHKYEWKAWHKSMQLILTGLSSFKPFVNSSIIRKRFVRQIHFIATYHSIWQTALEFYSFLHACFMVIHSLRPHKKRLGLTDVQCSCICLGPPLNVPTVLRTTIFYSVSSPHGRHFSAAASLLKGALLMAKLLPDEPLPNRRIWTYSAHPTRHNLLLCCEEVRPFLDLGSFWVLRLEVASFSERKMLFEAFIETFAP